MRKLSAFLASTDNKTVADDVGQQCCVPALSPRAPCLCPPFSQVLRADLEIVTKNVLEVMLVMANVDSLGTLLAFNLAPLRARRDIAMLGLIHRAATGKGPEQLKRFFQPAIQSC